jgi:hypothetical protein
MSFGSMGPGQMFNLTYTVKAAGESRKISRMVLITCGVFLAVGGVMFLVFGFLIH